MKALSITAAVLAVTFALGGCRMQIEVPGGATVKTDSERYECAAGSTCMIYITDSNFEENFYVIADPLNRFNGWKQADSHLCGGSLMPCALSTSGFDEHESLMSVLASDLAFYLSPSISKLNYRLSEKSVTVEGTDKPDAFMFLVANAVDLNHDGLDDFIYGGPIWIENGFVDKEVKLGVLINDGDYGFRDGIQEILAPGESIPKLVHAGGVEIADFNNDGYNDVVVIGGGYDGDPYPGERNILLLSQPNGKYKDVGIDSSAFNYSGMTHDVATADIDQDGDTDIITTDLLGSDISCSTMIRILENDSNGSFTSHSDRIPEKLRSGSACSGFWTTVELADFDGDKYPDMILGSGHVSQMKSYILWNDGQGNFDDPGSPPLEIPSASNRLVSDTDAIDLNDDGFLDLVIAKTKEQPFYEGRFLQTLLNSGERSFQVIPSTNYFPNLNKQNSWVPDMYLMDIDGDTQSDIFLTGHHGDYVQIRQSNKTFKTWAPSFFPARNRIPEGLAGPLTYPIDADNDGDIDFLQAHHNLGTHKAVWDLLINTE